MRSTLPTGSYRLPPLHEYTVTEGKPTLRFRELAVGQIFWIPRNRKAYIKTGENTIDAIEPDHPFELNMRVTDINFEVEL